DLRGPARRRGLPGPQPHPDRRPCRGLPDGLHGQPPGALRRRMGAQARTCRAVVHGLQVLAFTAPGATLFPHYIGEVFISLTELSCKFLKEVHSGDTLYSSLEI